MGATAAVERIARRDRLVVALALVVITGLAWLYLALEAARMAGGDMEGMAGAGVSGAEMAAMAGPMLGTWTATDAALMFAMWAIMMVAMMLPSAAPMMLFYATVARRTGGGGPGVDRSVDRSGGRSAGGPLVHGAAFAGAYVVVWTGFSALATAAQWALERAALLSPMMVSTSAVLGGGLLVLAGLYQLTPVKTACLRHCRSPARFLSRHWRPGAAGAFRLGLVHGLFCLGCCWLLMALLFVGGVMNLAWIAVLTAVVALEKLVPHGPWLGRAAGIALVGAGAVMLA
ncbi:MAG: DUF2182 domain-containing protein [Azospirillaceae bacterium]